MTGEKCERCKRGYPGGIPKEDVEWLETRSASAAQGRELRVARCTRCGSLLADLAGPERDKPGGESHDVCVLRGEQARAALVAREPLAIAAVSPQLRRRHLEELTATLELRDRSALERIERGEVAATEACRGLVTRALALGSELPPINDVRPRGRLVARSGAAAVGLRASLELGDGSRAVLEPRGATLSLARMRGDAAAFRVEIPTPSREAFLARVVGRVPAELVVLLGPAPGDGSGELFLVSAEDGAVRGPGRHDLRAASFEAHALPGGCIFLASYQHCAVVRPDAQVAWKGSATGFPVAVPVGDGAVVVDAPWRLVKLALPSGAERWRVPVDRAAALAPAGDGHVLVTSTDVVARLDVRGERPTLAWAAAGGAPLPLADGGAALVRERWEKAARVVECIVIAADGRRRFRLARPEATKTPVAELGPGVLLFHSAGDVAVSAQDRVTYAVSLPAGSTAFVTMDDGGAWIEYDGVVDRVDSAGQRAGRWRVG